MTEIKTMQDCISIFDYCKSRLPKMEGCKLSIEQAGTTTPLEGEFVPMKGVTMRFFSKGKELYSVTAVDEDDALLCIFSYLVRVLTDIKK